MTYLSSLTIKRGLTMSFKTYDIYDSLTCDELETITNIFLEALSRQNNIQPEVFELQTNIIVEAK
tara:strand:+ start:2870 stop:3064 length:195 start_codon:yes stop_codon:yes gene_type:complete